jgi:outer membrane protein TolC
MPSKRILKDQAIDPFWRKTEGILPPFIKRQTGRTPRLLLSRCLGIIVLFAMTCGIPAFQEGDLLPLAGNWRAEAFASQPDPPSAGQANKAPLSLGQCIQLALANNPDIAARKWEVTQAEAQKDGSRGASWPSVRATGGYNYFYFDAQRLIPARENGEPGVFSHTITGATLILSMPLFTGGQITNRIEASELLQAASENRLARTREELVFNITSVFDAILGQQQVIGSLRFSIDVLQQQISRIKDLISVQKGTKVDLLRTEVRLANLEQRLLQEKNTLLIQQRVLANLMGLKDSEGPMVIEGQLSFMPLKVDPEGLFPGVYKAREDYLAAKSELDAQERRVQIARAGHWPTVSLRGSYGLLYAPAAIPTRIPSNANGMENPHDVGAVGLFVDLSIFEGGQIDARIRDELARVKTQRERLRKLELQIRLEVETAAANVNSLRQRILTTEKSIEQAKESLEIEREKYGLGKSTITDVLDAQGALLEAQSIYYRALADHEAAKAQLRLATGEKP